MNEQEKELLLKDLCSRLLYGIKVCYRLSDNDKPTIETLSGHMLDYFNENSIIEVKPYLRPMESMSKEEIEDYHNLCTKQWNVHIDDYWYYDTVESIDWLNSHYFDYRGLIPIGIALPAKEGMYK